MTPYTIVILYLDTLKPKVLHVEAPSVADVPIPNDRPFVTVAIFKGHLTSLYHD